MFYWSFYGGRTPLIQVLLIFNFLKGGPASLPVKEGRHPRADIHVKEYFATFYIYIPSPIKTKRTWFNILFQTI